MEMAGGSPPAEVDINGNPNELPTARSVTTELSELWMKYSRYRRIWNGNGRWKSAG